MCPKYRAWSNGFLVGWLFTVAILIGPFLFMSCGQKADVNDERYFPAPIGYVNDFAHLLSNSERIQLDHKLRTAYKAGIVQMAIVTVPTLHGYDVADYTNILARKWKVGDKKVDNGIVFLIAFKERKTRLEVGYGNESRIPDSIAKRILADDAKPFLRTGDYAGGCNAVVDAVLKRLGGKE
jgi:uncharacterized protein